jgi:hypothetical protein
MTLPRRSQRHFDNHRACLWDLVPVLAGIFGVAESVTTDHNAVSEDDAVADGAPFANDDAIGVDERVIADGGFGIDGAVRMDRDAISDRDVVSR